MLWMLQRVVFGRATNPENARLSDMNAREVGLMIPLLILMLFMGLYPKPFLDRSRASVVEVRDRVRIPQRGGTIVESKEPLQVMSDK
jgi:NADH-quinone oxidoreductase subunit M